MVLVFCLRNPCAAGSIEYREARNGGTVPCNVTESTHPARTAATRAGQYIKSRARPARRGLPVSRASPAPRVRPALPAYQGQPVQQVLPALPARAAAELPGPRVRRVRPALPGLPVHRALARQDLPGRRALPVLPAPPDLPGLQAHPAAARQDPRARQAPQVRQVPPGRPEISAPPGRQVRQARPGRWAQLRRTLTICMFKPTQLRVATAARPIRFKP